MLISNNKKTQPRNSSDITLYGTKIETSNAEIYLGISYSSDGTNTNTTTLCMQVARQTGYSLMGAGLSGLNGIGLEVSKHIGTYMWCQG